MRNPSKIFLSSTSTIYEFRTLLISVALLKVALLFVLPLTGDEAYFIYWGQSLAWGYYDHPPAVGWLTYAMGQLADNLYWYRSFAYFGSILIAWVLYRWLLEEGFEQDRAKLTAAIFWLSPASLVFVLTTNDTVLVVTGVVGAYLFSRSIRGTDYFSAFGAGAFLALAFLSKYFAAFMVMGLMAYIAFNWKNISKGHLAVTALVALLGPLENLYFNYTHCWNNILFNFFSRTETGGFDWHNVSSFFLFLLILMTPWGLFLYAKHWRSHGQSINSLWWFASLPLFFVVFIVSFSNETGIHWLLLGAAILYGTVAKLPEKALKSWFRWNGYSAIIILAVGAISILNISALMDKKPKDLALYLEPEAVCSQLPSGIMFTTDYSSQSALAYHCQNDDIHVFNSRSKFGREDDKRIDFSSLDGQSLTVLLIKNNDMPKIASYFKNIDIKTLNPVLNTEYLLVNGNVFNYAQYRKDVIEKNINDYYTPPDWLAELMPGASCSIR